jgi:hypothetical protein
MTRTFARTLFGLCLVLLATPSAAQVSRVGDTFQVWSATSRGSDVAYDSRNGVYFVVAAHGTLFGRFVSADGGVLGSPLAIEAVPGFAQFPHVTYSPDADGGSGAFLVSWHESDASVPSIHTRLVSFTKGFISGDQKTVGNDTYWEIMGAPVVYSSASREFLLVWRQYADVNIFALRLNTSGLPVGSVIPVATGAIFESDPSVTYNSATDEYFVVYRAGSGSSFNVMGRRIQAGTGTLLGPAMPIGTGGADVRTTGVTYNATTNQYLVAWQQVPPDAILGRVVSANGTALGTVIPLSARFGTYDSLSVDANSVTGTAFMVGHDKLSVEDGGVEVSAAGQPGLATQVTAAGGGGNFYPRITSNSSRPEWLVVSSNNFARMTGQRIVTRSRGGAGAPPSGPLPLAVSVSRNVTSASVPQGTAVTWTASSSGGTAPITYQFWRFTAGSGWTVAQAYSTSNTLTWTPPAGDHLIQVWARNSGSSASLDASVQTSITVSSPTARVTSLTANVALPPAPGVPITWTATAAGSAEYRFWTYSTNTGRGVWTMMRDYSSTNTLTWTPPGGTNAVQVWVRRPGSTAAYEDARDSGMFTVTSSGARLVTLTSNVTFPTSPQQSITWKATGTGGSAALEYKFWMLDESLGTWSVLRDWAASNQVTWIPGTANAGRHRLQAWVRSSGSRLPWEDARDTGSFTLTDALHVTLTPTRALAGLRAATSVTFTAQVSGGSGPWEYVFYIWNGSTWTRQGSYSAAAGANMLTVPLTAGTKEVQVWVRAATGSHADLENWATSGMFVVNP